MDQIWKFKKALQSINSYPSIMPFKQQIERGNRQLLTLCLAQIQIILSNPNEPPFSKFLALRFCKEIMLYGRSEIISGMEKVLPVMTKIASYRMEVKDAERGTTYFRNVPDYAKMTPQDKAELDRIGCSFVLLALQSLKMWSTWIPVNINGSESIYKKSYNLLLERGVSFPQVTRYYKANDTQIFNQTYKVEFFQNSDLIQNSEISEVEVNVAEHLRTLAEQRQILNRLLQNQSPELQQTFHRRIVTLNKQSQHVRQYLERHRMNAQLRELMKEQQWINMYLQNHRELSNRISYDDFSRMLSGRLPTLFTPAVIQVKHQKIDEVILPVRPSLGLHTNGISLTSTQPITTIVKEEIQYHGVPISVPVSVNMTKMSSISSQQDKVKISMLASQLKSLEMDKEIFRSELEQMRMKYQSKINELRHEVQSQMQTKDMLSRQVEHLKLNMQQLLSSHAAEVAGLTRQIYQTKKMSSEQIVNIQHTKAEQTAEQLRKMKHLVQIERGEKLKTIQDMALLRQQIFKLQQQIHNLRSQNQNIESTLDKVAKEKKRLIEEITLYKTQLSQQRTKQHSARDFQTVKLNQTIIKLTSELEMLKLQLQTRSQQVTQRDLRLLQMQKRIIIVEQQKRKQLLNYQLQLQSIPPPSPPTIVERIIQRTPILQASRSQQNFNFTANSFRTDINPTRTFFQFKQMVPGMDEYYTFFVQNSKELRIRFCKAALKSKELLFKSNQLEVGVIWSKIDAGRIKGIFHYSNNSMSDHQEFKTKIYSPKGMRIDILTSLYPTLPMNQQQKQQISFSLLQLPLRKVVLQISYTNNNQPKLLTLLLPIFLLKYVQYYPPRRTFPSITTRRQFVPSSRIVKNLPSYFEELRQVGQNKFEAEVGYQSIGLGFKLVVVMEGEMMVLEVHSDGLGEKEGEVVEEYLNQLQYVLS